MKRLCVFCGSSFGGNPEYVKAARNLGNAIAKRNICLVYGGARVIEPEHRAMIIIDDDPESLLEKFSKYEPPKIDKAKWILGMMPKEEKGA